MRKSEKKFTATASATKSVFGIRVSAHFRVSVEEKISQKKFAKHIMYFPKRIFVTLNFYKISIFSRNAMLFFLFLIQVLLI